MALDGPSLACGRCSVGNSKPLALFPLCLAGEGLMHSGYRVDLWNGEKWVPQYAFPTLEEAYGWAEREAYSAYRVVPLDKQKYEEVTKW